MRFAIAHAAWLPERREPLRRLTFPLKGDEDHPIHILNSRGREHAAIWSRRLWEFCSQWDDHVVCLNDDVILHPKFTRVCEAIIEAVPDEPISLHTSMPAARDHAAGPWVRSSWLTGPAYILPPGYAHRLLDFTYRLPWSFLSRTNEDNVAIHFAWEQQKPFLCAVPAPVTHDTSVPSSLGYDHHPNRVPSVPWSDFPERDLTSASYWKLPGSVPVVPNPWMPEEKLEYMRRVLSVGRSFCVMCVSREAVVGTREVGLCNACIGQVYAASVGGQK